MTGGLGQFRHQRCGVDAGNNRNNRCAQKIRPKLSEKGRAAWTGDVTGGALSNGVAPKGKRRRQRYFGISEWHARLWMLACYSSNSVRRLNVAKNPPECRYSTRFALNNGERLFEPNSLILTKPRTVRRLPTSLRP